MECLAPGSENQKISLAAEILRRGDSISIRVRGMSMLPTIWPGDLVTIAPCTPDPLVPGEIVLHQNSDRVFIHRLVAESCTTNFDLLITRGDSMPNPDPAIPKSQVLGRVVSICRNGRTIIPACKLPFHARALGWMACYSTTVRSLALRFHSFFISKSEVSIAQEGNFRTEAQ